MAGSNPERDLTMDPGPTLGGLHFPLNFPLLCFLPWRQGNNTWNCNHLLGGPTLRSSSISLTTSTRTSTTGHQTLTWTSDHLNWVEDHLNLVGNHPNLEGSHQNWEGNDLNIRDPKQKITEVMNLDRIAPGFSGLPSCRHRQMTQNRSRNHYWNLRASIIWGRTS